jgi:hypothetical protein
MGIWVYGDMGIWGYVIWGREVSIYVGGDRWYEHIVYISSVY